MIIKCSECGKDFVIKYVQCSLNVHIKRQIKEMKCSKCVAKRFAKKPKKENFTTTADYYRNDPNSRNLPTNTGD